MISFLITLSLFIIVCYIIHLTYRMGYKEGYDKGYRDGGNMVLKQWKRSMDEQGDD